MEKSSKIALIIGCALIILFFIFTRKYVVKVDENENTINTTNNSINNIIEQNVNKEEMQNETKENENEVEENIMENVIEENIINKENNTNIDSNDQILDNTNTQIQGLEETTSSNEEKIINKKDEALRLVETEWGEDNSVYYTIDNESGNIFSISVRSKATTAVLQEYEVDVSKGIVTLK